MTNGICQRCGKPDEHLIKWLGEGGTMAYIHGHYSEWCQVCAAGSQLVYAKERAESIPRLEKELADQEARLGRKFEEKIGEGEDQ